MPESGHAYRPVVDVDFEDFRMDFRITPLEIPPLQSASGPNVDFPLNDTRGEVTRYLDFAERPPSLSRLASQPESEHGSRTVIGDHYHHYPNFAFNGSHIAMSTSKDNRNSAEPHSVQLKRAWPEVGGQMVPDWGLTQAAKTPLNIACLDCRERKIKCEPGVKGCIPCEKALRPCRKAVRESVQSSTPDDIPFVAISPIPTVALTLTAGHMAGRSCKLESVTEGSNSHGFFGDRELDEREQRDIDEALQQSKMTTAKEGERSIATQRKSLTLEIPRHPLHATREPQPSTLTLGPSEAPNRGSTFLSQQSHPSAQSHGMQEVQSRSGKHPHIQLAPPESREPLAEPDAEAYDISNSTRGGLFQLAQRRDHVQIQRLAMSPSTLPSISVPAQSPGNESNRSSTLLTPETTALSANPPLRHARSRSPMNLAVPNTTRGRAYSTSSGKLSIREASRDRDDARVTRIGQQCDDCDKIGSQRFFCNVCKLIFCDPCWSRQPTHRKALASATIPHEKTEHSVAKRVQHVLTPSLSTEDRERMHEADIDTTWFGVVRPEDNELPLFRDYGRYASVISEVKTIGLENASTFSATLDHSETLYPSLVSFVGQTGAGKSTLIKLLIDLKSEEGESERFPSPVVGAAGRDVSTSEDVHLYLDPDSSESQAPILFADCEGLEGGERDPVGAKLRKKIETARAAALGSRHRHRLKHISEREVLWARDSRKRSREFAVAHLYPRLLYTFSDVIVFVLKNARTAEGVLERLVDWAQAALEKSSNQPVLPHAIIVLNASENNIPEEAWDPDIATESLLDSLSRTVHYNPTFQRFAQFWRSRDRQIETVQELLLSYYSSLRVVRVPTDGRPNLIRTQVGKLSDMIKWASKVAREAKADLHMLLDADEFQPYLQTAFDHFSEDLDTPFDFVQASFTNSPIPNNFGGNILKVALQIMECWGHRIGGATIFEETSYLVASCIMLDAARNRIRGTDEQIFPTYMGHLDNALENFCDRHWPCEFVDAKGDRCVNVRSGHGKGHQSKSGKLLAVGDYHSNFSFENYQQEFQAITYNKLQALRKRMRTHLADGTSEEEAAANIHRELVLPSFFEHASNQKIRAFSSHTVCFCCLFEPSEHALPCGHILCTPCLKTYGGLSTLGFYEISECPLERKEKRFRKGWQIYVKPPNCGVRVLTLDGGGVRGIVELETLQQLKKELGGGIHIQSFFDLIVGTSTGGIIALGLTARNWTLDECVRQFTSLCEKAFVLRKGMGMGIPGLNWMISNYNHSKYETRPLQEALIEAFGDNEYLFGGQRKDSGSMDVKVAVTATYAASSAVVLTNYTRLCHDKLSYHFHRPEKLQGELKTWEVARASSAAPTYFKPFLHENSKQVYSDGGIFYNNPIAIADQERKLIWPAHQDEEPDVIVSLGTLCCRHVKNKPSVDFAARGIIAHNRFLAKIGQDHVKMSLDSERTWRDYINTKAPSAANEGRYIRINPELQESPPKLDDIGQIGHMQEVTRHQVGSSLAIQNLARRLVASCFYFDVTESVKEDSQGKGFEIKGSFRCRLLILSEVAELGKFIGNQAVGGEDAHFMIREEGNDTTSVQKYHFDSRTLDRMIFNRGFRMPLVTIRRSNQLARTEILLCFRRDAAAPISRFPRCLHMEKPVRPTNRHVLTSTSSVRWAGRTKSQQDRKKHWRPPQPASPLETGDVIERFSSDDHLIGNATVHDLNRSFAASATEFSEPESIPRPPAVSSSRSYTFPFSAESYSAPRVVSPASAVELSTEPAQIYFRVVHDWHSQLDDRLDLKRGDLVKILEFGNDGWWCGHSSRSPTQGWMPASLLTPAEVGARFHLEDNELTSNMTPVFLHIQSMRHHLEIEK